ncbi:S-(hydroxymethyl)glutathione dehydrogenase [Colletotrichum sp. SAR11_59]|nr:S-(hydroxymethyl)glutathione dehydrogenase [Colletotrichum sp. SAR11_59]
MTAYNSPRPKTMKGVVWEGKPYEMAVKHDIPVPRITEPEDAIIRITTSAICGSDLHTYHGFFGSHEVPFAMGHEAMGIVEEIGDAVDSFKVGDRVVVGFPQDGYVQTQNHLQLELVTYGFGQDFGGIGGLQTEYVRVPHADSSLFKIPKRLPDKEWLFIGDIFPTAWEGLTWSGFQPGDTVAVFGAGPVGLMCAYSAIIRGASLVYIVDHVPQRLAKAAGIGAVPINFARGGATASEQILALQPGGVNRAVDCCGQMAAVNAELKPQQDYVLREAVKVTSFGGGIGVPGVYASLEKSAGAPKADEMRPELKFPFADAWFKSITIKLGIVELLETVPALVRLIENGRARPGFVVTSEVDIDEAPKAYGRFDKKLETKVLLRGPGKEGREDFVWEAEQQSNGVVVNGADHTRISGKTKRVRLH